MPETFCKLTSALRIAANHCAALRDIDNIQLFSSCEREVNSPLTGDRALGSGRVDDLDLLVILQRRNKKHKLILDSCEMSLKAVGRDGDKRSQNRL